MHVSDECRPTSCVLTGIITVVVFLETPDEKRSILFINHKIILSLPHFREN